jgi:hypothetical protein
MSPFLPSLFFPERKAGKHERLDATVNFDIVSGNRSYPRLVGKEQSLESITKTDHGNNRPHLSRSVDTVLVWLPDSWTRTLDL